MSLVLDAGAFIAWERGSREMRAVLEGAFRTHVPLRTSTAVVAQVWRPGGHKAKLALLLAAVEEVPLSPTAARGVGGLLAGCRTQDVVDAALVELAHDGDEILTSDPSDLLRLANASGKTLMITAVT